MCMEMEPQSRVSGTVVCSRSSPFLPPVHRAILRTQERDQKYHCRERAYLYPMSLLGRSCLMLSAVTFSSDNPESLGTCLMGLLSQTFARL